MAPHIGLKHVLNDELQIELKPFAWVTQNKNRWISSMELFPKVGAYEFFNGGSTARRTSYFA